MIIYKAINIVNGKVYIGQTIRPLKERMREHFHISKGGRFRTYFYNAVQKHGKENFKWEIIDSAKTMESLNEKEQFWIFTLNATDKTKGYNNKLGGMNGCHLPEARKKISDAGRRPCSDETKSKISAANKGQVPWAKGRRFTKEHKLKMAMSQKNRVINPEIASQIKALISQGIKSVDIAKQFNIKTYIVYNIKHKKTWKEA